MKNQKGITLIALVITIIVMLILVVVTINIAKDGGLFKTARDAASDTQIEAEREELLGYQYGKWYNVATNTLNLNGLKEEEFDNNANWEVEDDAIKRDENGDYLSLKNKKTENIHKLYGNMKLVSIKAEANQGGLGETESTEEPAFFGKINQMYLTQYEDFLEKNPTLPINLDTQGEKKLLVRSVYNTGDLNDLNNANNITEAEPAIQAANVNKNSEAYSTYYEPFEDRISIFINNDKIYFITVEYESNDISCFSYDIVEKSKNKLIVLGNGNKKFPVFLSDDGNTMYFLMIGK